MWSSSTRPAWSGRGTWPRLHRSHRAGGGQVVLVGDPRQLPEIEAGGAFAAIVGRIGAIELTENRRQHQAWERIALDALRLGRAGFALASYDDAGRVHLAPTMAEAREQLVESWCSPTSPVTTPSCWRSLAARWGRSTTPPEAPCVERNRLGADVLEVDETGFALGDKVVCLRNDRRLGVLNGTVGTVEGVRLGGLARRDAPTGRAICRRRYLEDGHLAHGYALTVHKAQGLTVERAFVLATESLTQEAGYVAMSRARSGTELFVPVDASGEDPSGHDAPPPGWTTRWRARCDDWAPLVPSNWPCPNSPQRQSNPPARTGTFQTAPSIVKARRSEVAMGPRAMIRRRRAPRRGSATGRATTP